MRDDLNRLIEIVKSDSRYRVTVVFDRYVTCRQIRFLYADTDIPCFLDLFVYDWSTSPGRQRAEKLRRLRVGLAEEVGRDDGLAFWGSTPHCPENTDGTNLIQAHFDRCYQGSLDCGVACDGKDAGGIVWAVDSLSCSRLP